MSTSQDLTQKLLNLQSRIKRSEMEKARLEGELKQVDAGFQELGISLDDPEAANRELASLSRRIESMRSQLGDNMARLEQEVAKYEGSL